MIQAIVFRFTNRRITTAAMVDAGFVIFYYKPGVNKGVIGIKMTLPGNKHERKTALR